MPTNKNKSPKKEQKKTKKETQKTTKQAVLEGNFDFTNVSRADTLFNSDADNDNDIENEELVPIKFKIHKNYMMLFHKFRNKYAVSSKSYNFSSPEMFKVSIMFLYNKFKQDNILKKCDANFKKAMIRPGRRKMNERTFKSDKTAEMVLNIPQSMADKYLDLMYSFILNDPDDNIFNDHHSRTYFFYDFLELIKENKKDFLAFKF